MDKKPIEQAIRELSEYYDCVVILASSYENGVTDWSYRSYGNHMTREGMVNNYLRLFEEDCQTQSREVDGGEDWKSTNV